MTDYLFFSRHTGAFLGYQERTDVCSAIKAFCAETDMTDFDIEKIAIKTRRQCSGVWAIEAAKHDIPWSLSKRATHDSEQLIGISPEDAYAMLVENKASIYLSRGVADD